MSFFTDSNGEQIEQSEEYTAGGFQRLIPAYTILDCVIVGASWEPATQYRNQIVKVMLMVTGKGAYQNYIVNDNIKCFDNDPKKADKDIKKLMTYDSIGKGLLFKADKAGKDIVDDTDLLEKSLCGEALSITFDVWKLEGRDGEMRSGNWVRKIEGIEDKNIIQKARNQPNVNAPIVPPPSDSDTDFPEDEIPF